MHTRDIGRAVSAAVVVLVGALTLAPGVASASGGGGCGQAVTDATGTAVEIHDFCFSPTILRVRVGAEVTFANVDPVPHSVLGANATWGDYAGFRKKTVTYRFSEPGVYPYVCTYHVGMVGVVVVGDGVGGATGATTADGPVTKVDASELAFENTAAVTGTASPEASGWVVGAAAALAIVAGAVAAIAVRRRRSVAGGAGPGR